MNGTVVLNQSASAPASPSSSTAGRTDTPPVIQINGDNPATIQVAATITGPQADITLVSDLSQRHA